MRRIDYKDMKKGEYYAMYKNLSTSKTIFIFQMTDSQPVLGTFSIIKVSNAWGRNADALGRNVAYREDYATNLDPDTQFIFELDTSEVNMHLICPQI